jgi:malonate decarboxylase alpha subunit
LKADTAARLKEAEAFREEEKIVAPENLVGLLEKVTKPGDMVGVEGNNQKQADFLAACLCRVDPQKGHGLHMVQSVSALPSHLDVFEKGIAKKIDFAFAGP